MKYQSQYEQDRFVDEVIFNGRNNGFFVDIGAYDGITLSNTYYFEKYRNFNGICIEPNPSVYRRLVDNRASKNMNVCVGNAKGRVKYLCVEGYAEMLSCIYDESKKDHISRIGESIRNHGGSIELIEVDLLTFKDIMEGYSGKIDFLSIDTEGSEMEVIEFIDFSKYHISVLAVENNNQGVKEYLSKFNFRAFFTLGSDIIYVKEEEISLMLKIRKFIFMFKKRVGDYYRKYLATDGFHI
jgi:FkbM family methyltransferase